MKRVKKSISFFSVILVIVFSLFYILNNNDSIIKESYANEPLKDVILQDNDASLRVYYFDVGQADSTLIIDKDKSVLIDAGNNNDGEGLVEFIKSLKITKIDFVIGTHAHEDHIGGMDDIINNFDIGSFYMPDVTTTTRVFEDVLDSLLDKNLKFNTFSVGDSFSLNDAEFKVLYVGGDSKDLNDTSIVLKMTYGNYSYLFMGDASSKVEKKLLSSSQIESNIIKIGHHGSSYSTSLDFLNLVNPSYAIISVGKDNKYNHPSDEVIKRLNNKNINVYRTDLSGTILITSDKENINITTVKTSIDGGK